MTADLCTECVREEVVWRLKCVSHRQMFIDVWEDKQEHCRRSIWAVEEGLDPPGIFYRKPIPWALSTVCLSSFSKSCGTFPSLELSKLFRESKIVRVWMTILNSNLQWVEALSDSCLLPWSWICLFSFFSLLPTEGYSTPGLVTFSIGLPGLWEKKQKQNYI